MKVLIFMTQFYQLSGAERLAVELAEELNKRGIHADILSQYTGDLPGVAEAKEALLQKGIPNVHFLDMRLHPPIWSMVPAIRKLRLLIRKHRYDIVETSMLSPSVIAAWAMRGTRVRHVEGLHQVFRRDRENSWQHKFWRFSVRCNRGTRYYAISDFVRDQWIKYSRTSLQHTRRIYNAIPDDCFEATAERGEVRRNLGIPEDARVAIYVGRLAAYKGIDTILDALGPLLEQENILVLYVGLPDYSVQGTREMLQAMEQQIEKEHWSTRVKLLGYRTDVRGLMASSDILVHPTRIEGFGLTLAEAMAAGLPVVASNVEGIPEVLAGTDSLMVPPDDLDGFREAVLRTLHREPHEAIQAIEKGRTRAEDFRMNRRTEDMIRLFDDVLERRFL
jgi:glycosyltransferase involved in cell wall biosynthesis